MKYFTRAFFDGSLSLTYQARLARYNAYMRRLSGFGLSPALDALRHLNLHDALVLATAYEPKLGTLILRVNRGDLRVGYASTTLTFFNVASSEKSLRLLHDAVRPSNVEILSSELDIAQYGYVFRLLFWPKGEATLKFKKVAIRSRAVSGRKRF
jgi:hypothetical protein